MSNILCILQARYNSTRLPGKMLLTLGGETLIERAWRVACEAFGRENCIVAVPDNPDNQPLVAELLRIRARVYLCDGLESDVLGRFYAIAAEQKFYSVSTDITDDDDVIVRITPDDHRKDVDSLRRVANGERLPVEMGGEAFTFSQLRHAHMSESDPYKREHITYALFDTHPPAPPDDGLPWSIDTQDDLDAARAYLNPRQLMGIPCS